MLGGKRAELLRATVRERNVRGCNLLKVGDDRQGRRWIGTDHTRSIDIPVRDLVVAHKNADAVKTSAASRCHRLESVRRNLRLSALCLDLPCLPPRPRVLQILLRLGSLTFGHIRHADVLRLESPLPASGPRVRPFSRRRAADYATRHCRIGDGRLVEEVQLAFCIDR